MDTNEQKKTVEDKLTFAFERTILDKLALSANVTAVFGDPIDRDGVTVIPVAKVFWAGGVGGGRMVDDGEQSGGGGGGGTSLSKPAGYIVVKDGEAEYRPI